MAEYSFLDIFATKGLEYLVVIAYFVLFVVFIKKLNAPGGARTKKTGKE